MPPCSPGSGIRTLWRYWGQVTPHVPLVILSKSMVDLIPQSVSHVRAPVHAVYTAEEAQAYKPRMQAFGSMFDRFGCEPEQMMHVSSSFRYDLMTASGLGFMAEAFIASGIGPFQSGSSCGRCGGRRTR